MCTEIAQKIRILPYIEKCTNDLILPYMEIYTHHCMHDPQARS